MTVWCRKTRRGAYERRDGLPAYIMEVYEVGGLPLDADLTPGDVIAMALAVPDSPLPAEGATREGLFQSRYVVEPVLETGRKRRIVVAWGRRRGGSVTLRAERAVATEGVSVIQPWLTEAEQSGHTYYDLKRRQVSRGGVRLMQGRYIDAGSSESSLLVTAASFRNHLYTVSGQPALFVGLQLNRRESGELWAWTIFETTGWMAAVPADTIEDGQLPIAELPPLHEYAHPNADDGTLAVPPDQVYKIGSPLPWL